MAWSLACAATISRWTPASTSFASARLRPKSAMSTRPSGRLISTTSAHDPSPSAPISTSLKTQATYPPSVRERVRKYPTAVAPPISRRSRMGTRGGFEELLRKSRPRLAPPVRATPRRGSAPDQTDPALAESRGIGGRSRDPERDGDATRRLEHPSNNLAKLPFDPSMRVPRTRLRPCYGDGFDGAPLMGRRPRGEGRAVGGGADDPARSANPASAGAGES